MSTSKATYRSLDPCGAWVSRVGNRVLAMPARMPEEVDVLVDGEFTAFLPVSEYRLDVTRTGAGSATLSCSACGHSFATLTPGDPDSDAQVTPCCPVCGSHRAEDDPLLVEWPTSGPGRRPSREAYVTGPRPEAVTGDDAHGA